MSSRTVGEYQSPKEIENVIITRRNGVPIYLRDVARARLGYKKPQSRGWNRSFDSMALPVTKVPGSNVLEVMEGLKEAVAELNEGLLAERGLVLVRAYDSTDYIYRSIGLVRQSLLIGGALAIGILLLFLRSGNQHADCRLCHSISVVGTFPDDELVRTDPQCDQFGGNGLCGGHGGGQFHRRARKHLPASADGKAPLPGSL